MISKKSMIALILSSMVLVLGFYLYTSTYSRYHSAGDIVRISSKDELSGHCNEWVEVEFTYSINAMYGRGHWFSDNSNFAILKLPGKEEFVVAATNDVAQTALENKNYFFRAAKAKEMEDGETYSIVGYAMKIAEDDKKELMGRVETSSGNGKLPNRLSNTNYDIVVQIMSPDKEEEKGKSVAFLFWGTLVVWVVIITVIVRGRVKAKNTKNTRERVSIWK